MRPGTPRGARGCAEQGCGCSHLLEGHTTGLWHQEVDKDGHAGDAGGTAVVGRCGDAVKVSAAAVREAVRRAPRHSLPDERPGSPNQFQSWQELWLAGAVREPI